MGSLGDPIRAGNAVDSTVAACPCRRTGFHFAGTCCRDEVPDALFLMQQDCPGKTFARRDPSVTSPRAQGCPGKVANGCARSLDCFVARAPRNDGVRFPLTSPRHCERSEAIQAPRSKAWIAWSQGRLCPPGFSARLAHHCP